MANDEDYNLFIPALNGRKVLYTGYKEVNENNILDVLKDVYPFFLENKIAIQYLQAYRRGVQPILYRKKTIRKDIKNIVVKNRANEIVNFKVGYLLGEPVQYVARAEANDEDVQNELNKLNDFCYVNKKFNLDKELGDYMYTCGTAYRMVMPNKSYKKGDKNSSPFEIYTLDPAFNAVVYSTDLDHRPLLSITQIFTKDKQGNNIEKVCCYTDTKYFEIQRDSSDSENITYRRLKVSTNTLGTIPIIEYPLNLQRMGAFEPVITILDAINTVESNRVDSIEQAVQSLMVFMNVDIDSEGIKDLQEQGAICLSANENTGVRQDVKFLTNDIKQTETQTLVDSLEEDVLTLCGMPNRNGGTSTSDTGTAVIMRDGWSDAEARAKEDELTFRDSEVEFLKLALKIMSTKDESDLRLNVPNVDIRFTRKNYENITQKTTVLTQMLGCEKIDPQLAFTSCGIFPDPQLAYKQSMEYYEKAKIQTEQENEVNDIANG